MTPTLTRAPERAKCRFCPNGAVVRTPKALIGDGPGFYEPIDLCDPCRQALAAPVPRKEFAAVDGHGVPIFFRRTATWVEHRGGRWGRDDWHSLNKECHTSALTPSELRAIADALEDGAR